MAEYFRDQGQDVLLFIDNIFRFVQAGSEVSALLGRMPSAVGYQPTLATEMGQLQERITSTRDGSVTSVQAIYVPADDLTDPAPANTFAHLDAFITLSRSIAEKGSTRRSTRSARTRAPSRRGIVSRRALRHGARVQEILQRYKDLQDIIAILGIDELSDEDKLSSSAPARSSASSRSRCSSPRSSPGRPAPTSSSRTRSGFQEILDGKHDDLPEQAFYMVGTIDDAVGSGRAERFR